MSSWRLSIGLMLLSLLGCTARTDLFREAARPALNKDPEIERYFDAVGDRLIAAAKEKTPNPPPVKFYLSGGKTMNVATLGTGSVYITSRLFQACKSEDELAAMMAHGYAHVLLGHSRISATRTQGGAPGMALFAAEHPFTADQEIEANQTAYWIYARGGWAPDRFGLSSVEMKPEWKEMQRPASSQDWRTRPVADENRFRQYQSKAAARASELISRETNLIDALPSCVLEDDPDAQLARRDLQYQDRHFDKGGGETVTPRASSRGPGSAVVPGE
jgi:hypothetical protein